MPPGSHETIPLPERRSSNVYKYGVKVKEKDGGKWSFACLGSSFCRLQSKKGIFIAIGPKSASNATDHIAAKHNAGELLLPSSFAIKHRRRLCAGYFFVFVLSSHLFSRVRWAYHTGYLA